MFVFTVRFYQHKVVAYNRACVNVCGYISMFVVTCQCLWLNVNVWGYMSMFGVTCQCLWLIANAWGYMSMFVVKCQCL